MEAKFKFSCWHASLHKIMHQIRLVAFHTARPKVGLAHQSSKEACTPADEQLVRGPWRAQWVYNCDNRSILKWIWSASINSLSPLPVIKPSILCCVRPTRWSVMRPCKSQRHYFQCHMLTNGFFGKKNSMLDLHILAAEAKNRLRVQRQFA